MSMKGYGRLIRGFGDLTICQLFFTDRGKVKRFYVLKIPDFSSKSLRTIFDKHISKTARVTTDE